MKQLPKTRVLKLLPKTRELKQLPKTSVEAITENESAEAITENERAENYPLKRMLADLKHQNIIYPPDTSREGKEMKANQPRNYSYPDRKFEKNERSFLPSSP